jgi:hypothetical protein
MDFATISAALGSLKTATEIAKFFRDSDLSLEKAESKLKLAELISALADAKIQISDIQLAMSEKENELRELKNQSELQASLKWDDPYYWRVDGGSKEGPFCQPCYDKQKLLSRLTLVEQGSWNCRVCNQFFTDRNYISEGSSKSVTDYDPLAGPGGWMSR